MHTEYIENPADDDGMYERIEAARRTRLATAFVAIIFLTAVLVYLYRTHFQEMGRGTEAMALMVVVGLALFVTPRGRAEVLTDSLILKFYKSHRFYGAVIAASAALVFLYAQFIVPKDTVLVRPVPVVAPSVSVPAPAPVATPEPRAIVKAPPVFPKLTLTGVSIGNLSSAIINGKTVYEGEAIEGVRVLKVTENYSLVELDGHTNRLTRFDRLQSSSAKVAGK